MDRRVEPAGAPTNGEHVPEAVLQAVTRALDEAGLLDDDVPLYDAVEPGALGALHRHATQVSDSTVRVAFDYADHPVHVEVGRRIRVQVD